MKSSFLHNFTVYIVPVSPRHVNQTVGLEPTRQSSYNGGRPIFRELPPCMLTRIYITAARQAGSGWTRSCAVDLLRPAGSRLRPGRSRRRRHDRGLRRRGGRARCRILQESFSRTGQTAFYLLLMPGHKPFPHEGSLAPDRQCAAVIRSVGAYARAAGHHARLRERAGADE